MPKTKLGGYLWIAFWVWGGMIFITLGFPTLLFILVNGVPRF